MFIKGYTPWNKGKTGIKTSNKGSRPWNKGLHYDNKSPSRFKKGQIPPKHKQYCKCFRCSNKPYWTGKKRQDMKNEKHFMWKGDNASYTAIHQWIKRYYGKPRYCSNDLSHKSPYYHWANISGKYKRDISDWHSLCVHCNLTDGVHIPKKYKT